MKMQFLIRAMFALILFFPSTIFSVQNNLDSILEDVEKYLNNITTFESDFVQVDRKGNISTGHFWLKRPYLMKMAYINPPTHVVIAKDDHVIHYNRELKEQTRTSMYSSPLSFFLERKINIRNNLNVLYAKKTNDALYIKFCKKDSNVAGAVLLVFSLNPLELRKWIIFDDQKNESRDKSIEISLFKWVVGKEISNKEFSKFN